MVVVRGCGVRVIVGISVRVIVGISVCVIVDGLINPTALAWLIGC